VEVGGTLENIVVPDGFDFATATDLRVTLAVDPPGQADPLRPRVQVGVPDAEGAFDLVIEGFLDTEGRFSVTVPVPTRLERVFVRYETGSRVRHLTLPITGTRARFPGPVLSDSTTSGGLTPAWASGDDAGLRTDGPQSLPDDLANFPIAYVSYHPSQASWGTIAFEDNWPSKGDYDFNDLVVSYHVVQYRNPSYDMVAMEFFMKVEAVGAGFRNGFGFALPIDRRRVIRSYGSVSARNDDLGMEPGQDQAVFMVFDDPADVIPGGTMINTLPGSSRVSGEELRVVVQFRTPLKDSDLGAPPFNPFLVVNGNRGREVHLIGKPPTALMNAAHIGTGDDVGGFRTRRGLPWALLLPTAWEWPTERTPVDEAHLEFVDWAESGGTSYTDWYLDKGANRKSDLVFR
jgi:LruC domain-containing protein